MAGIVALGGFIFTDLYSKINTNQDDVGKVEKTLAGLEPKLSSLEKRVRDLESEYKEQRTKLANVSERLAVLEGSSSKKTATKINHLNGWFFCIYNYKCILCLVYICNALKNKGNNLIHGCHFV